jgi:hypothetical protein
MKLKIASTNFVAEKSDRGGIESGGGHPHLLQRFSV